MGLVMTKNEPKLRKRLQGITEVEDASQQAILLDTLTRECPNEIELLESPYPIERYTCLMHVFEFTDSPEYAAIASRGFNVVYASPTFAHWLLDHSFLDEIPPEEVEKGDLVFYFSEDGRIKHAGLVVGDNRVESKWGLGHLFQHGLFEVPESYGTRVRFFKKIDYDTASGHFRRFAKDKGMFL
jgi:hypothetical protein